MTGYTASVVQTTTFSTSPVATVAITPVTYQIRIAKIEAYIGGSYSSVFPEFKVSKYLGGSVSGGTTVTPRPLRDGAPSSSATVKSGVTPSGTLSQIVDQTNVSGSLSYQFTFDCILSPGVSVFYASMAGGTDAGGGGYIASLLITYEELHLARSV